MLTALYPTSHTTGSRLCLTLAAFAGIDAAGSVYCASRLSHAPHPASRTTTTTYGLSSPSYFSSIVRLFVDTEHGNRLFEYWGKKSTRLFLFHFSLIFSRLHPVSRPSISSLFCQFSCKVPTPLLRI